MKLTQNEFNVLEKMHLELKVLKLEAENQEKERKIKALGRRIFELEASVIANKHSHLIGKAKNKEKELFAFREKVAKRLNVESLDEYFVDDVTLELKHESTLDKA